MPLVGNVEKTQTPPSRTIRANAIDRPIVYVIPVTHFGGSLQSSIALLRELGKSAPVSCLDFYGGCREFLSALRESGIPNRVLLPGARWQIIGGRNPLTRSARMAASSLEYLKVIVQLRRALTELHPSFIWVDCEKALFAVRRAVGKLYPTVYFIRGAHPRPSSLMKRDWEGLDAVVCNNRASIDLFIRYGWDRERLFLAQNGVDVIESESVPHLQSPLPDLDASVRIVMPATLIPVKAHAVAIRGFAAYATKHDDSTMWICGDTPNRLSLDYENSLRTLAGDLGVSEKVHFLGWRNDVPAIMKAANVFLLTSDSEGLPRSLLEAMLLGLPSICTAVGGVPDVITNGRDGFLVERGHWEDVALALEKLRDPAARRVMGGHAMQTVRSRFTIEEQAGQFMDILSHPGAGRTGHV